MTLSQLLDGFPNEESCRQHLLKRRWPNGVSCPRCKATERVYKVTARPWSWVCKNCDKRGYRFALTTGTVFENTKYPLRTWFQVIYLMCQSKKGMSAKQIQRTIECSSYETAWYMCHRVRAAMKNGTFRRLTGEVEIDETYLGGSDKNRHKSKRKGEHGSKGKVAVIGAIARKGNVTCQVLERVTGTKMDEFVRRTVSPSVSLVATDEHKGYARLGRLGYKHETVNHTAGEYVRGHVHTANLDSFWSLLKRGVMGSFHQVSRSYLPLYLNEFSFRHNHRDDPFIFDKVLSSC